MDICRADAAVVAAGSRIEAEADSARLEAVEGVRDAVEPGPVCGVGVAGRPPDGLRAWAGKAAGLGGRAGVGPARRMVSVCALACWRLRW